MRRVHNNIIVIDIIRRIILDKLYVSFASISYQYHTYLHMFWKLFCRYTIACSLQIVNCNYEYKTFSSSIIFSQIKNRIYTNRYLPIGRIKMYYRNTRFSRSNNIMVSKTNCEFFTVSIIILYNIERAPKWFRFLNFGEFLIFIATRNPSTHINISILYYI